MPERRASDRMMPVRTPICAWYSNGGGYYPDEPEPPKKSEEPEKPTPGPGPEPPKPSHALVLGRFLPPHAGHQYVVDVARQLAPTVTVLARTTPSDAIAARVRLPWLHELFGARTAELTGRAPDAPASTPAFWQTWRDRVGAALAQLPSAPRVDLLVSSDREAWRLAELLGAGHVLVDPDRTVVPISATAIRRNPLAFWGFLPPPVRAHYARRVVVIGPESSGKSTFARALAETLGTVHVPEQARLFARRTGGLIRNCDLPAIAALQRASEDAAARRAERFVIADTDALSLQLWAERLFGAAPALPLHRPDLYLVTDASVPFAGSPDRDEPEARRTFAARCLEAARSSGAPVVPLPADPAARLATALRAIDALAARSR